MTIGTASADNGRMQSFEKERLLPQSKINLEDSLFPPKDGIITSRKAPKCVYTGTVHLVERQIILSAAMSETVSPLVCDTMRQVIQQLLKSGKFEISIQHGTDGKARMDSNYIELFTQMVDSFTSGGA